VALARAVWVLVGAVFLLNLLVTVTGELFGGGPTGLQPAFRDGALVVLAVTPGSPAGRTGLLPGDRLRRVGGRDVGHMGAWTHCRANLVPGEVVAVEGSRGGRPLRLQMAVPAHAPLDAFALTRLSVRLAQLVTLAVALLIAWRRPLQPQALLGAWFLASVASSSVVPATSAAVFWRALPTPLRESLWLPILSSVMVATLLLAFFCAFPRPLLRRAWQWVALWAPSLLGLAYMVGYFRRLLADAPQPAPPPGVVEIGVVKNLLFVLLGFAVLAWGHHRASDVNERRKMRVLLVGMAVGCLPVLPVFAALYSPVAAGWAPYVLSPPALVLLNLLVLAFPLSFAYAVLRHRLFDVRLIVRRGLQHALARRTVLALSPAVLALLVLDLLLHGEQPLLAVLVERGWLYGALLLLAVLAVRFREPWLLALDRRFFREPYDARRLLRRLLDGLRDAEGLESAAPRVVAVVEAALHPAFVALFADVGRGRSLPLEGQGDGGMGVSTDAGEGVGTLARRQGEAPSGACAEGAAWAGRGAAAGSARGGALLPLASAPAGQPLPPLPTERHLGRVLRTRAAPLEVGATAGVRLTEALEEEDRRFLAGAEAELLVPIAATRPGLRAVLVLGGKRSEEPYGEEDRDLLQAVAAGLSLLLERSTKAPPPARGFLVCPGCGRCFDPPATQCDGCGRALEERRLPRLLAGRYQLERLLGSGGMGEVYRAFDTALERAVAVKVLAEPLVGDPVAVERFRHEAKLAAALSHPHLVAVYDFGIVGGRQGFLVLELLSGQTLRAAIDRNGPLPPAEVVRLGRQLLAAVSTLHAHRLVHCDLKPENVFLVATPPTAGEGPTLKLLDFGVARRLEPQPPAAGGDRLGTLYYMAPERMRGGPLAASWDLWAMAVVLYEMVTGSYPFPSDTREAWRDAVLAGGIWSTEDERLDALFRRALAPQAADRPTGAAWLGELERLLGERSKVAKG
jgi:tRNA A-37 threonylcarbamoyl transferase component Bud32